MTDNQKQILDEFGAILKEYTVPIGQNGFERVRWEGAFLYGAQLGGANFSQADLYWVNFSTAHLDGANFANADMQGADLSHASCVGTNFRDANLERDNLGGRTKLQGADLTAAILDGTRLNGAEYDAQTLFPTGFDPSACGMVKR